MDFHRGGPVTVAL